MAKTAAIISICCDNEKKMLNVRWANGKFFTFFRKLKNFFRQTRNFSIRLAYCKEQNAQKIKISSKFGQNFVKILDFQSKIFCKFDIF